MLDEKDSITAVFVEASMEGFLAVSIKRLFNRNLEKEMQNWLILPKRKCERQQVNRRAESINR
ncbi:MAG: hypothetical protein EA392_05995 [Cryomorphaceae bacterium]|nr:MAG: hypothetical protein EA392_05995 [Cryomorphaceae bacterium]